MVLFGLTAILICKSKDSPMLRKIILLFFPLMSGISLSSVEEMTLEEKVGQLFIVQFHGEVANEDARLLIQEIKVGGFIYYNWANGLTSPEQVKNLSQELQELAKKNPKPIPLFIAIDQEGGIVSRLNQGFTVFPGNKALAMTGDPDLTEASAFAMGEEMKAVGINMNFAPDVDINTNPKNPIIGIRSFGDDPAVVCFLGKKALDGYHKAGVITTLKHFPGHGDVEVDSHESLPTIHKSLERLKQEELVPFMRLASDTDAVMTAHILVPALDNENCATLSAKTLGYLREIGFKGVIIADSLVMEGVIKQGHTVEEAAIRSLIAGCDILLLGGKLLAGEKRDYELNALDIQRIHRAIVEAVMSGRIPQKRVDEAVQNILTLKEKYQIREKVLSESLAKINTLTNQELSQKIASEAIKSAIRNPNTIGSLKEKRIAVFAPEILQKSLRQSSISKISESVDLYFFSGLNPEKEEISSLRKMAKGAEVFMIFSYNAWKNPSQVSLIHALIEEDKPVILVVTRDPLDNELFPKADAIFTTFSPVAPSIQAVCDLCKQP